MIWQRGRLQRTVTFSAAQGDATPAARTWSVRHPAGVEHHVRSDRRPATVAAPAVRPPTRARAPCPGALVDTRTSAVKPLAQSRSESSAMPSTASAVGRTKRVSPQVGAGASGGLGVCGVGGVGCRDDGVVGRRNVRDARRRACLSSSAAPRSVGIVRSGRAGGTGSPVHPCGQRAVNVASNNERSTVLHLRYPANAALPTTRPRRDMVRGGAKRGETGAHAETRTPAR